MDIKITHNWLKEYLDTKATPEKIAECLSLCGPSVERIHKIDGDFVYDIEVTTNRVDTASVMGIAREAATILPQFNISAKFKTSDLVIPKVNNKDLVDLNIDTSSKYTKRVMAVVIEVKNESSPGWMKERLEAAGIRSKSILIDITNYVMLEIGHPTHVFDYDKIANQTLRFRLSKKGEKLTTLDNKTYTLAGNDIVIDDGKKEIIDLPGIMGTKNSVVSDSTKRVVFFVDNCDALTLRKTSLNLGIRTMAVQLNEKGIDPELGKLALARGLDLYQKFASGKIVSKIYDLYDEKPHIVAIKVDLQFINKKLGIELTAKQVGEILTNLGFKIKLNKDKFIVTPPSFRSTDIQIPEDIVEEVARIYGYFNIPSTLMATAIPQNDQDSIFEFESKVKTILEGFGGIEVYTTSLVSKLLAGKNALRLKNPLGADTEYLQTSLIPSMIEAAKQNSGEKDFFHLFQIANVYIAQKSGLPNEVMTLSGIIVNADLRHAKGIVEALIEKLNINVRIESLGKFEQVSKNMYVYEFGISKLQDHYKQFKKYKPLSKYPAQIEDITIKIPHGIKVGNVLEDIKSVSDLIMKVELRDIYKNSHTFRIWYHNPDKTMTNEEVEKIREKILTKTEQH